MSTSMRTPAIEIHRHYEPGVIGWIGELHGRFYAQAWGTGATFEILTVRAVCDFIEQYDPAKDLLLTAHADGELIGSLAVQGRVTAEDTAQIRFVIVDPSHHGKGIGKTLLCTALDWCHEAAYRTIFLWTVDHPSQSQALAMYERSGFRIVERIRDSRYSVLHDSLRMERRA